MTTRAAYVDRDGGHPPSWLRACHGPCEATGHYPVFHRIGPLTFDTAAPAASLDVDDLIAWSRAHHLAGFHDCDGWHAVTCADCAGTGRAPWLVTIARLPRWLWGWIRHGGAFT